MTGEIQKFNIFEREEVIRIQPPHFFSSFNLARRNYSSTVHAAIDRRTV